MSEASLINDGVECAPQPTCVICGRDGRTIHTDLRDVLFGAPGTWSFRQCTNADCGVGWIDPMPAVADIGKLYETYYTHGSAGPGDGGEAEHSEDAMAAGAWSAPSGLQGAVKSLLARIFPQRRLQFETALMHFADKRPGRMLEVGCGSGAFMAAAAAAGWQVLGIDADEAAVAAARKIPGADAQVMDIHDARLDGERFDGIAFNNVIEHLPDPARVFARCRQLLAPGGRLVMVTPNIDAQCHGAFGPNWRGLEIPRHLCVFSGRALDKLARDAGFSDVQVFCPLGGYQIDMMVDASTEIARRTGSPVPQVDRRGLKLRNAASALMGGMRGEWVVIACHA